MKCLCTCWSLHRHRRWCIRSIGTYPDVVHRYSPGEEPYGTASDMKLSADGCPSSEPCNCGSLKRESTDSSAGDFRNGSFDERRTLDAVLIAAQPTIRLGSNEMLRAIWSQRIDLGLVQVPMASLLEAAQLAALSFLPPVFRNRTT
jgi:hypothetical protein